MNTLRRRCLFATGVTLLLHALFLLLLYYLRLDGKERERRYEEVVLLDLGNVQEAGGEEEPEGLKMEGEVDEPEVVPQPQPEKLKPKNPDLNLQKPVDKPKLPPKQAEKPIQTQTHEESLRIKAEEAKKKATEAELAKQQAEAEAKRKAEAEAAAQAEKRRQVGNSVAGAFGAGRGKGTSQGTGEGQGNQGSVNGVAGGSFSLSGRSIISNGGMLTTPKTNKAIEGKLVIAIEVDSRGQVVSASVAPKGSNISDPTVRAEALRAARSTSFNPQEGASTQRGTITYIYVLRQ